LLVGREESFLELVLDLEPQPHGLLLEVDVKLEKQELVTTVLLC
jgi:hypothetical protein